MGIFFIILLLILFVGLFILLLRQRIIVGLYMATMIVKNGIRIL